MHRWIPRLLCVEGERHAGNLKASIILSKFNWWKILIMWLLGNRSISPPLTTLHFRIDKMLNTEHLDTILENDILEVLQKLRRSTRSWGKGVSWSPPWSSSWHLAPSQNILDLPGMAPPGTTWYHLTLPCTTWHHLAPSQTILDHPVSSWTIWVSYRTVKNTETILLDEIHHSQNIWSQSSANNLGTRWHHLYWL